MPSEEDSSEFPGSLKRGYKNFVTTDCAKKKDFFEALETNGQSPKILWIGCVDSRVMPGKIFGSDPGEVMIHRNVGTMVPPYAADEASVGSVVHYALAHLKVRHIVVCGHSDCGGIKSLMQLAKVGMDKMLSSWVEYGISALEDDEEQTLESVTRTNVIKQAGRLLGYPDVAKGIRENTLWIHPLYFDIPTGTLEEFDHAKSEWVDFS